LISASIRASQVLATHCLCSLHRAAIKTGVEQLESLSSTISRISLLSKMTDKLTVSSDSGEVSDRSYRTADDLSSLCVRRHMYTPAKQQGHGSMIHPPILSYSAMVGRRCFALFSKISTRTPSKVQYCRIRASTNESGIGNYRIRLNLLGMNLSI
jgi:hypothetical protein